MVVVDANLICKLEHWDIHINMEEIIVEGITEEDISTIRECLNYVQVNVDQIDILLKAKVIICKLDQLINYFETHKTH